MIVRSLAITSDKSPFTFAIDNYRVFWLSMQSSSINNSLDLTTTVPQNLASVQQSSKAAA
jgi:hypothetical protein